MNELALAILLCAPFACSWIICHLVEANGKRHSEEIAALRKDLGLEEKP